MGQVSERLEAKLRAAFHPEAIAVIDQTNEHHGHAAWRESGETHFRIEMTAAAFAGKSRVERQRLVYAVLANDMDNPVHALSLQIHAPGEQSPKS